MKSKCSKLMIACFAIIIGMVLEVKAKECWWTGDSYQCEPDVPDVPDVPDISVGAVIGIVIGGIVLFIVIPILICFFCACACFSGRKNQVHTTYITTAPQPPPNSYPQQPTLIVSTTSNQPLPYPYTSESTQGQDGYAPPHYQAQTPYPTSQNQNAPPPGLVQKS